MESLRGELFHSRGHKLEYLILLPSESRGSDLHIFLHGFSRIESQTPPVFYRRKWAASSGMACLFLSDPIHRYTRQSACGWYLLGQDEFQGKVLALRDEISAQHDLRGTVWHGPSSGGYAAVKFCLASPSPDLAFVVAPHNDPRRSPQWFDEAEPFKDAPAMAPPSPLTDLIAGWDSVPGRHLACAISENDLHFAHKHFRPLLVALGGRPNVQMLLLRNGLGHGLISDTDYTVQLDRAVALWREHRDSSGESSP